MGEIQSARAALILHKNGFKNVFVVIGGLDEMPNAGFTLYRNGDIIQKINGEWYKNGKKR
ncbi:MAG: hypothetical protein JW902_05350 [Syntrophaceae bacterium]|nr:hypothetical protein [Syntrophaceae bacterium]